MNFLSPIYRFRIVALLEGISYLLFGITMPLKYVLHIPEPNYVIGMLHGVLFITYIILAFQCIWIYKWSVKKSLFVLLASLVPIATFLVDYYILKPEIESS